MARQGLELHIEQKQALALTPQLLQAIKVLAMTRTELGDYVAAELEGNPVLEADWDGEQPGGESAPDEEFGVDAPIGTPAPPEDFDWAEYLKEKEYDDVSYGYGYGAPAEGFAERPGLGPTLREHLLEQISDGDLRRVHRDPARAYEIVEAVIESLDENGFLTQTAAETAAAAGAAEAEAAIRAVRGFEPAGVAAADVREALVLQYERAGGDDPLVKEIIETRLADVAARSAAAVSRSLGRKRPDVERAFEAIAALNPKPGRGFQDGAETHYITPDIIIEKTNEGYEARVNSENLPSLTVSPYYRKVLAETRKGDEAHDFLTERLNAASALIKSLERRRQTVYNITTAILRRQYAFMDEGKAFLKPMTLKQVADEIGVHESTVSRAVRGKYVQTPRGVIELKAFFGSGVRSTDGEGISAQRVKALIKGFVAAEDRRAPLSDLELADALEKSGVFLSRRTVAKYRGEAEIPSSAKRAKRATGETLRKGERNGK
ncbi:MAG: RNA polymerase factor sigma-54 [Clostridiales Family XIII bacterium]|jgi:RNA polymerase sigma-54 factor|nr:RNA polymerase factor sigma-54 [Clostridiales Family XIII bacterium]